MKVPNDQIQWLAKATVGQRGTVLWGQYRKLRLTGSNVGYMGSYIAQTVIVP